MARNVRSNYLTDKVSRSSTAPIGSIVPVFDASGTNIADTGVIDSYSSPLSSGSGYNTTGSNNNPYGLFMLPKSYAVNSTGSSGSTSTNGINTTNNTFYVANHGLSNGDKLIVKSNTQGTICVVGTYSLIYGRTFYAASVTTNTFKLSLTYAQATAATPTTQTIDTLGTSGTITFVGSIGYGATVFAIANASNQISGITIKNPGYGYAVDDVLYVQQPGSGNNAKFRVVTVLNLNSVSDQYEGWLYCDGSTYNANDYPLLFKIIGTQYGGTAGNSQQLSAFGSMTGTFKVPDYKTRTLVGTGAVAGGSTPIYGNVISAVGNSGGKWYFSKTSQESKFSIGNVVITGYSNITDIATATLSGSQKLRVGPLSEKLLTGIPEHNHDVLCSESNEVGVRQGNTLANDYYCASYKTSSTGIQYFFPPDSASITHTHGFVDYVSTDPTTSTYGEFIGPGEKNEITVTASNISSNQITSSSHGLVTGNRIVVKENTQSTKATTQITGQSAVAIETDLFYYVIKINDNTFKLASTKNEAASNTALTLTSGTGGNIVFYTSYKAAGQLPQTPVTTISTPSPLVYDFDNNSVVGGKTIITQGQTTYTYEIKYNSATQGAGTFNIAAPTVSGTEIEVRLQGDNGTGASTNSDGTNGSSASFTISGTTWTAGGGGKGFKPSSATSTTGGAGGSAGATTTPASAPTGGTYTGTPSYVSGNAGGAGGGYIGSSAPQGGQGGQDPQGFTGNGGDGSSSYISNVVSFSSSYTSSTSLGSTSTTYTIPGTGYPLTSLTINVRGGGGGNGAGGGGGIGNGGKRVIATAKVGTGGLNTGNVLVIYVGGGGGSGSGLTGGSASQTGFSRGGNGGNGNGGLGGGAGGSSSAVGLQSPATTLVGAGGGGGGGGQGDGVADSYQTGQLNGTDDAQGLSSVFAGTGANGAGASCTSAGGGGGGGGVGTTSGSGGGGGGTVVHNGDGYGGSRGQSAYDTDYIQSVTNSGGQNSSGGTGSVDISGSYDASYYGAAGGGGGSGSYVFFRLTGILAGSSVTVGSGAYAMVRYGTPSTTTGTSTSVTVGLIDSSSDGVDYVSSGTGSGSTGGFTSPDSQLYLRFSGNGTAGVRFANTIELNGQNINNMVVRAIVGNNSNGGEIPEEPLSIYYSVDNGTSWTVAGQLIPAYTTATEVNAAGANVWKDYTFNFLPEMQDPDVLLSFRQNHSGGDSTSTNDNFGIEKVTFNYNQVETTTYVTQAGKLPMNIDFIDEDIPPSGNPISSAGVEINDGTFKMSSSVPLSITSDLVPKIDIPLITRYHRVKYMIKAF
jgi:hypothetical protein